MKAIAVFIGGTCAFFAPVKLVLLAVGLAIIWNTISELYVASKKQREVLRCVLYKKALKRMVWTMLMFQAVILSVFIIDREIVGEFVALSVTIKFALTKLAAATLICIECYFIDRNVKRVKGIGLLGMIGKAAGLARKIKGETKGLLVMIPFMLFSCTTMKNAERRHGRIVEKFPFVHTQDTVTFTDTLRLEVPRMEADTVFQFSQLYDTLFFARDGVMVKTWVHDTTIVQEIVREPKTYTKTIVRKVPIRYYNSPLEWWQRPLSIVLFILASLGAGIWITKHFTGNGQANTGENQ